MGNTALGLGIIAVVAAIIGYSMFRGSRTKPTTGNGGGDPGGGAGGWEGSHGHSDAGGGDGGGGGD